MSGWSVTAPPGRAPADTLAGDTTPRTDFELIVSLKKSDAVGDILMVVLGLGSVVSLAMVDVGTVAQKSRQNPRPACAKAQPRAAAELPQSSAVLRLALLGGALGSNPSD